MATIYTVVQTATGNCVQVTATGVGIPTNANNPDYQAYLNWVSMGNTADFVPYVAPTVPTFITATTLPINTVVAKSFGQISAAAGTLDAGYNVASLVKSGTGQWVVTFTTPMPTANYSVNVTADFSAVTTLLQLGIKTGTKTASSFTILIFNVLGALVDPSGKIYFNVFST